MAKMSDPSIYWMSFVKKGTFVGACLVEAADEAAAIMRAEALGIHPGGEIAFLHITREGSDPVAFDMALKHIDRLFHTREEIEGLFGESGSAADASAAGQNVTYVCEECSRPS